MAVIKNSVTYTSTNSAIVINYYRPKLNRKEKGSWVEPSEVATQFSNRIIIDSNEINIAVLVNWCLENGISQYHYDIVNFYCNPNGKYMRMFSFAKKEDAMAFKLSFV